MADNDVFKTLVKVHKMHPSLRLGQLIVVAASKVGLSTSDNAQTFYISDDKLMIGLGMMASELTSDGAAKKADRIKSYLARKVGSTLDGETVNHIAKIIQGTAT